MICPNCHGKRYFESYFPCPECNAIGIVSCCDAAGSQQEEVSMSELLVMRLGDMGRIHPNQDNSHVCSRCGFAVGIYPSGQDHLRKHPDTIIVCSHCADKYVRRTPVAPIDEIRKEMQESMPRKR